MRVHEYLKYLVIENRIVTYEYFMDEMQDWEISLLVPMMHEAHRTEWETARYVVYNNAMYSGNIKKQYWEKPMQELFPLPYDPEEVHNYEMSDKNRDLLRERGKRMSEWMKKKNKEKEHGK